MVSLLRLSMTNSPFGLNVEYALFLVPAGTPLMASPVPGASSGASPSAPSSSKGEQGASDGEGTRR